MFIYHTTVLQLGLKVHNASRVLTKAAQLKKNQSWQMFQSTQVLIWDQAISNLVVQTKLQFTRLILGRLINNSPLMPALLTEQSWKPRCRRLSLFLVPRLASVMSQPMITQLRMLASSFKALKVIKQFPIIKKQASSLGHKTSLTLQLKRKRHLQNNLVQMITRLC